MGGFGTGTRDVVAAENIPQQRRDRVDVDGGAGVGCLYIAATPINQPYPPLRGARLPESEKS